MAGQVWSAADFDASNTLRFEGGPGSVLAVVSQNAGPDGIWNTPDDLDTPMNKRPGEVSLDMNPRENCTDNDDRVRGFAGQHVKGVMFVFADGSTHFLSESLDPITYRAMSTAAGSEVLVETPQ